MIRRRRTCGPSSQSAETESSPIPTEKTRRQETAGRVRYLTDTFCWRLRSGYRGTLQFRQCADFHSHTSGLGGTLHHFARSRVADERTGLASRNLAQCYLTKARQSKPARAAWMHRAQHYGLQRIKNTDSCLAGDVILLSNQIDER